LKHNEGLANPSSPISESTFEVNNVEYSSVSFLHHIISIRNMEVPISRTDMRLLTKVGYNGGQLGVNGKGMTQRLEFLQRP